MNFNQIEDRRHLLDMVDHSRKKLDDVRCARRKLLERTKGSEWFPSEEKTPLNQMAQQEWALVQHLAGGNPRALVLPGGQGLEAVAYEQTLAINKEADRLNLRRKFRRLVQDALYGIGICRIGMVRSQNISIHEIAPELDEEGEVGVGQLEVQVISLESWVHDCQADCLEEREFCGHAYWVDKEDIDEYLPGVKREDLDVEEKRWIDEHGTEMAGAISRGVDGEGTSRYRDKYWLWDLWCPKEKVIVTTPVNGTGEIAHVRPWRSRPGGPYLFLYYRELPDQAIPLSIQADLALVHDSLNSTFRKLIDQTRESKTVLGFKPGHEGDAQNILDATSRQAVSMRDPNAVNEFNFNGPDQSLLGMLLQTRELASIIGGNTDVLAGLGAQAPTATQEQMVNQQAGGKIALHEVDTADFQQEVFEAIRWYIYHEQEVPIPLVGEVENTDIRFPTSFNAAKAEMLPGTFNAFQLKIEPYTEIYQSPTQRFQSLMMLWERLIMPAVQAGIIDSTPDINALLGIAAQYLNMPEIKQLLREVSPEEQAMMSGGEARQSPTTTRNYIRRSAPGPTRAGNAMQAMTMMGASKNGS
jgi:hypothetical protein